MTKEDYKDKLNDWIDKTRTICGVIAASTVNPPIQYPKDDYDTLSGTYLCTVYMRETKGDEWKLNTAVKYYWGTDELMLYFQTDKRSENGNQLYGKGNLTELYSLDESLDIAAGVLENIEQTTPPYNRVL